MWYNTWEVEREKFHLNFENGDIEEIPPQLFFSGCHMLYPYYVG